MFITLNIHVYNKPTFLNEVKEFLELFWDIRKSILRGTYQEKSCKQVAHKIKNTFNQIWTLTMQTTIQYSNDLWFLKGAVSIEHIS